jgi:hypothetical protein
MKILHISNHSVVRCGVAEYGRQWSAALRALGHQVDDWDGYYPSVYARHQIGSEGYWPETIGAYDVVHLNWQPGTLNHYTPEVWGWLREYPRLPLLSVFLHDIPPWSTCAIADLAAVRSAFEPWADAIVMPPPCLPPWPAVPLAPTPTIGRTGIGQDGAATLADLCARHGWILSDSDPIWVSNDAELARLARCWVNVVWYDVQRSRSSAASLIACARRPTVLSQCSRFDHLRPWKQEFAWASPTSLEETLVGLMRDVETQQTLVIPTFAVEALQWPTVIAPLMAAWEARCGS